MTRVIRGMHGPTCLDQRDSRLAVKLVFFSTPIPTLSLSGYKTPGELYDRGWGKKGEMNTTRVPMDFDRKYETDVT